MLYNPLTYKTGSSTCPACLYRPFASFPDPPVQLLSAPPARTPVLAPSAPAPPPRIRSIAQHPYSAQKAAVPSFSFKDQLNGISL